jgi:accessory gene regulator protein AgrB
MYLSFHLKIDNIIVTLLSIIIRDLVHLLNPSITKKFPLVVTQLEQKSGKSYSTVVDNTIKFNLFHLCALEGIDCNKCMFPPKPR